jgi:glycosyltransferase involved in cell wall biosynthesis
VGSGTAIFLLGACFHPEERLSGLEILVGGEPHRPDAWRMPRLDLFRIAENPEAGWYRSGFWATVPVEARSEPGAVEVELAASLEGGRRLTAPLGRIEVVEPEPPPSMPKVGSELIAVCMATFEPDMELFRIQVESLRAQTDTGWTCLVCDDGSAPERFDLIRAEVADDPRFVLHRSPRNLGYYRNFERALRLVPREAELVALCDHDDRWHPGKLAELRRALGSAQLVYSDQRLVDRDGRVLRETLWKGRRNNHTNLASLLVANSITGAATLFRREVAERAVPFPDPPGWQFHDHWLALVALASGDVAYVDRPLYDYVQHPGAVVGQAVGSGGDGGPGGRRSGGALARLRGFTRGWRARYFYGYVARELMARALLVRCGPVLSARKRRTLERFLAAPRSPLAFGWLAVRPLRALAGANETLGTESELARGIIWRHLIALRTGRRDSPGRSPYEATCPPLDAAALGQERLARWRARV